MHFHLKFVGHQDHKPTARSARLFHAEPLAGFGRLGQPIRLPGLSDLIQSIRQSQG